MGNTNEALRRNGIDKDHPHIHGEYCKKRMKHCEEMGSPPHTWGIPTFNQQAFQQLGITPTYMGNTCLFRLYCEEFVDHPHIHGEYQKSGLASQPAKGSPPHTWGIPSDDIMILLIVRITPTYMGNTGSCRVR